MEHIKPTEELPSFEKMRYVTLDGLESWDYVKHLERKVKKNHSDIFDLMEKHSSSLDGYFVISEIFRLEETIMVLKSWVIRSSFDEDDEFSYLRNTIKTK